MIRQCLPCALAGILLSGCAANTGVSDARDVAVYGYLYHDGNHNGGAAQASPQAIYNATHGTWLWPPAEGDVPPN
jgi:hypothetical protein